MVMKMVTAAALMLDSKRNLSSNKKTKKLPSVVLSLEQKQRVAEEAFRQNMKQPHDCWRRCSNCVIRCSGLMPVGSKPSETVGGAGIHTENCREREA